MLLRVRRLLSICFATADADHPVFGLGADAILRTIGTQDGLTPAIKSGSVIGKTMLAWRIKRRASAKCGTPRRRVLAAGGGHPQRSTLAVVDQGQVSAGRVLACIRERRHFVGTGIADVRWAGRPQAVSSTSRRLLRGTKLRRRCRRHNGAALRADQNVGLPGRLAAAGPFPVGTPAVILPTMLPEYTTAPKTSSTSASTGSVRKAPNRCCPTLVH
jgi:hypothetical protein